MNSSDIRKRFLDFFEKRGHTIVPSSSLVPQNDPSVLFTTAGMQQFKPYYIGKADAMKDFKSLNTASVQKCIRTSDIDEVGDESHLTFFEMLGNFSFGGYFKEEAVQYAHEFVTKEMGLTIDYVSVFGGEGEVPPDEESEKIWNEIDPSITVKKFGRADNFWGPTGEEGPCGPTSEIYVDGIEIWNLVFNQYYQHPDKRLELLPTPGVDTGMGLERLALVSQFPKQIGKKTIFDTDLFSSVMHSIIKVVGDKPIPKIRLIADHLRASVFVLADGVRPSNTERGYVLRRLIRRAMLAHYRYIGAGLDPMFFKSTVDEIIRVYGAVKNYSYLKEQNKEFEQVLSAEAGQFAQTLEQGLKKFEKGERNPFVLFSTYGFPLEMTVELVKEHGGTVDEDVFKEKMQAHQEISRGGAEQKFKGGLGGHSDTEIKYHTATHLLNAALREILGTHIKQRGSNITTERLRFDFAHPQKLTDEEKKKVEDLVNQKIREDLRVVRREMPRDEAEQLGAEMEFGAKYPDVVSVYSIEDKRGNVFSREFCGGPHVGRIGTLGHFTITKEESVAAGVRRIKAVLK